ncbi:hypothetical protein GF352_03305 [archaeon]|nr:hypothetical protein [archaeon]
MINKRLCFVIGLTAFLIISLVIMVLLPPEVSVPELKEDFNSFYNSSERVIIRVSFNSTNLREYVDFDTGRELKLTFFEGGILVDQDSCFSNRTYSETTPYTLSGTIRKASGLEEEVFYFKCDQPVI